MLFLVMTQNTLGQSVCRIFFSFALFDLLILMTGAHCYILLVFVLKQIFFILHKFWHNLAKVSLDICNYIVGLLSKRQANPNEFPIWQSNICSAVFLKM